MDEASNIFSVICAADVVIRSSTKLYDLLKRTVAAPENRLQLVSTLEILSNVTTEIQDYAKQYAESTYIKEDGLKQLQALERILKDCHFHITRLTDLVESCPITMSDTLIRNLKMRFKYVSKESEFSKSCQKLKDQMISIMLILHVKSAEHDVVLRDKVMSLDTTIERCQIRQDKGFEDMKQIMVATRKNIQHIPPLIGDMRHLITASGKENLQAADRILAKLDETTNYLAKLSLTMTSKENILVEGRGLEYIIMPLSLIQPYLRDVIQLLIRDEIVEVSKSDGDWIRIELMQLLASAHEEAARSLRSGNLLDQSAYQYLYSIPAYHSTSDSNAKNPTFTFHEIFLGRDSVAKSRFRTMIKTRGGLLTVECLKIHNPKKRQHARSKKDGYESLEFRFFFAPQVVGNTITESVAGMSAFLSRSCDGINLQPKITRSVREVNVVHWDSQAFRCVRKNDAGGLQKLLAQKRASPFDYSESGRSLLCEAALGLRLECVELLLQQGADPHNCHLGSSNCRELSYVLWRHLSPEYLWGVKLYYTIRKLHPLTAQAIRQWGQELDEAFLDRAKTGTLDPFAYLLINLFKQRNGHPRSYLWNSISMKTKAINVGLKLRVESHPDVELI